MCCVCLAQVGVLSKRLDESSKSAKQAINDKSQGSVATYLRCGGLLITKLRKKRSLLNVRVKNFFKIGKYLAELQSRAWLSHAFCVHDQHTAKRRRG